MLAGADLSISAEHLDRHIEDRRRLEPLPQQSDCVSRGDACIAR
jgi:hypothetical protein